MRPTHMFLAACLPTAALGADVRLVEREHLQCVIDNAFVYQAEPEFPVVVIFEKCPDTTGARSAANLEHARNSAFPTGERSDFDPTRPVSMALLDRAYLECLIDRGVELWPDNEDLAVLPDSVCGR